ncbi:MAG: RsmE family RNA methyltransferase [Candidatus Omnitrophica bacterium]|jgi:16S rRNA (uracil1498-N3)-methyltransferase|nr:RsmE family RNA methyltransferase [Candidatus Omnitrophota bacterium]MDD5078248.1 RsmE family RNA methyltransferase [Candidatus Omnitrophota bacterium]MDD5725091.1 RsmE family RNA methyltransferase [Candidatus Omnitrophota bacterium]
MRRFLVEKIILEGEIFFLKDREQLHHLRNVLRINPGDEVAVFDRFGVEYLFTVLESDEDCVKLKVRERRPLNGLETEITVACALPKNVKMDDIIDKLTQLGVARIIPLRTARVIVKIDKEKGARRLERWEKIAQSALKQSQRNKHIRISPLTAFSQAVRETQGAALKLIATLEGERRTLKEALGGSGRQFKEVVLFIGPEGDFTPQEVSLARTCGFLPVSLGAQVLRVDTAAIAAASFIKFNAEE